jgi:hypothetical protein
MSPYQRIAAYMMLLSGITHPAQMLFYGMAPEIRDPATAGIIFFPVGLGLLTRFRLALFVAITLPLLGGMAALLRIFNATPTPFTYFHALIDFAVVGLCIATFVTTRSTPNERGQGEFDIPSD